MIYAEPIDAAEEAQADEEAVPTQERAILAFLARVSNFRFGDDRLSDMLKHPLSRQVAEAILNPSQPPADDKVGRYAIRLFLDADNRSGADLLRKAMASS